ncbi:hypothetical protein SAMN04488136_14112 [Vibrio xiamenensis]|uniref:CAAX prenyl protease 2/Lysostaphin resistance protein A-like domain-containing protein n=1 Tax=Vibrio xiamenensis TaxID=861298 RepID=A0A1G8GUY9_9VIBR|nr:CPBP family intramembrane glutamic endopeptidase [Vibrio xiamenensis]SDH98172.1 hypothetical protein SAMN04488136_14112 [Vibrio xiamenensis]
MEKHPNFPNFWHTILILCLWFGLTVLVQFLAYDLGWLMPIGDPRNLLYPSLTTGIVIYGLMRYQGLNYRQLFSPSSTTPSTKSLVTLLTFPIALLSISALVWMTNISWWLEQRFPIAQSQQLMEFRLISSGWHSLLWVGLITPLINELLFRGILLRAFVSQYTVTNAILLCSLLATAIQPSVAYMPEAFLFSCLLGWLYVRSRSLWPSIIASVIYCTVGIVVWHQFHVGHLFSTSQSAPFSLLATVVALLGSGVGAAMLWYLLGSRGQAFVPFSDSDKKPPNSY